MSVTQEHEQVERTVELLDVLDEIEEAEPAVRARRIAHVRRKQLDALGAMRISTAARLLGVAEPTARLWADEGLLEEVARRPVRRVSGKSVLRVRPIVRELKKQGRSRNLLEAVFNRLDDQLQLADSGLQESLEQMRRGEVIDITPA